MKKIFVVEHDDSGKLVGFSNVDQARRYVISYYRENFRELYDGCDSDSIKKYVPDDLIGLMDELPYIEGNLYTRIVEVYDEEDA